MSAHDPSARAIQSRDNGFVQIAVLLFDGITALDAVGPYEVLSRLPGAEVHFVASKPGEMRDSNGFLALVADRSLDEVARPDVLLVPGGPGSRSAMHDEAILDWVRSAHEHTRWTTSVCTGSLILGAAGLLKGVRATTHWLCLPMLDELGAIPTSERVVEHGRIISAAGVSAGTGSPSQ